MCGRLVRDENFDPAQLGFAGFSETAFTPRYNIAPTQLDLIGRVDEDGRRLVPSFWGLIPTWAKERAIGGRLFNARAETLTERPAFRALIARHRCIVPASGFYEWRADPAGRRSKQPLYIHRADGRPMALAGLWTVWRDPVRGGEPVTSHTIVTCAPNRFMAPIHNRMPVVLDGDALMAWLDPGLTRPADVLPLLAPCPDDLLTAYPVAPRVNDVRNDGPDLIAPLPDRGT